MSELEYVKKLKKVFEHNKSKRFVRMELLYNFGSLNYRYAYSAKDDKNNFYAISVCAGNVLKYNTESRVLSFLGNIQGRDFEYTGGAFDKKRRCIWGFPRNSDKLLRIDVDSGKVSEIPLNIKFNAKGIHGAHHYSGILFNDHIYCPPRMASDGILKISLENNFNSEIIPLNDMVGMQTHYSGTILHPNGSIYFLPSLGNRITVYDTLNDDIRFIGDTVNFMNFGGVVWQDGNIYCICGKGVLKIDVHNQSAEIVYKFGYPQYYYGTMLHPNGKIYAYGAKNILIEYDPQNNYTEVVARFYDLKNSFSQSTAGEVMSDGNIYLAPCQGRFFMRLVFD